MVVQTFTAKDYKTSVHNTWCPGCGDFAILNSVQNALVELQVPPHMVAVVSGIGCSGKSPHYINAYGFHTLHGRALPSATGVKLANPKLTVVAVGGDGDGFGIGAGYFINTGRRNVDMTYLVFDNQVYGLTKGQASPTMNKGDKAKGMAEAAVQDSVNPLALAISAGYTFVARGYALQPRSLAQIIAEAIRHRGTSFVDIMQTCPVYNDLHDKDWYGEKLDGRPRLYQLDDTDFDPVVHDPRDPEEIIAKKVQAIAKSYEWGARIPTGILYKLETSTYEDSMAAGRPRGMESVLDPNLTDRDLTRLIDALR
ncbi:MAG: 2-oxoacid:ferredoxin oxidoreductase subunit beta [Dehalococcoidia bacterium]|nr:2-oxoacid:ferredoxin oxidoreductase subunit beta [Dehalococcoidia bacterium]